MTISTEVVYNLVAYKVCKIYIEKFNLIVKYKIKDNDFILPKIS